jgi:hypothetical protein
MGYTMVEIRSFVFLYALQGAPDPEECAGSGDPTRAGNEFVMICTNDLDRTSAECRLSSRFSAGAPGRETRELRKSD